MSELKQRYPNMRRFLFYASVNQGFLVSATVRTNQELRALQAVDSVDHYIVPCSPSGNLPATHWGASGLVRRNEADHLLDYYQSIARNDIDSWVLSADGMRLWSKQAGWIEPPDGPWTFDQFLAATPPALQRIILDPEATTINFLVIADMMNVSWANNKVEAVTDDSWDHILMGFSSTGSAPAEYRACALRLLADELSEVEAVFSPGSASKAWAVVTNPQWQMIWNNVDGHVPPVQIVKAESLGDGIGQQIILGYPTGS